MKKKSIRNIVGTAVPVALACGLLATASSARGDEDQRGGNAQCSNRTIRGVYGYASEGVLIDIPGLPPEAPFRSIGRTLFDGKGNLSWVEHTLINGIPVGEDWTGATGTYIVHANCTGTAVVNTPNSRDPLTLFFVVVKEGKEVHSVLNVGAVSTTFTKVD